MENLTIDILKENDTNYFVIYGNINDLTINKRLILSLKRLNYTIRNNQILVPFRNENQISILQEIEGLFLKFKIEIEYSNKTKEDQINFYREKELFNLFSKKAYSIRNDEFEKYPELINEFDCFQKILQEELKRTLYPLQLLSAFHIAFSQNACNFAVPGAGKTSIVYGAYAYLKSLPKSDPKHVDKLIVIGPISSFAPWENEYFDCFGKKIYSQRLSGDINISKQEKLEYFYSSNPAEVGLIFHGGVSSFQNELIDFLKKHKTMVVVDEAHRIKNPEGIWGSSVTEISKEASARVVLTGTPLPNGYEDIYNLYKFIYPFKY